MNLTPQWLCLWGCFQKRLTRNGNEVLALQWLHPPACGPSIKKQKEGTMLPVYLCLLLSECISCLCDAATILCWLSNAVSFSVHHWNLISESSGVFKVSVLELLDEAYSSETEQVQNSFSLHNAPGHCWTTQPSPLSQWNKSPFQTFILAVFNL